MYKLYTDKSEIFECEVSIRNASLKGHIARLVVEAGDVNLIFKGKIENGGCSIPIKKLKGILEENTKGKLHLEVIVEDTYFKPWSDDFVVEDHTSIKVQVKEQVEPKKPIVEVKTIKNSPLLKPQKIDDVSLAAAELSVICESFGIHPSNFRSKKSEFKQIVKEYFNINFEYNKKKSSILRDLAKILK